MIKKSNLAKKDTELVKSVRKMKLKTLLKFREFIPAIFILIAGILMRFVVFLVESINQTDKHSCSFRVNKVRRQFKRPIKGTHKKVMLSSH